VTARATFAADLLRELELAIRPCRPPAPDRAEMLAELQRPAVAKPLAALARELGLPTSAFRLALADTLALFRLCELEARAAVLEGNDAR
jgi:hypothetical protein